MDPSFDALPPGESARLARVVLDLVRHLTLRGADERDRAVAAALGTLAQAAGADHACSALLAPEGTTLECAHAWRANDDAPAAFASTLPLADLGDWWTRLEAGEQVATDDLSATLSAAPSGPPHARTRRESGVGSLRYLPMRHEHGGFGFLAFESRAAGAWSSSASATLAAGALVIGSRLVTHASTRERDLALADLRSLAAEVPSGLFRFERRPDDRAIFEARLARSAAGLTRWDHEFRVFDRTGDVRVLYGRATPSREPDGGLVWNGVLQDVSERAELANALRRSEHDLRTILDLSDDAVVLVDDERRVVAFNPAAAERARRLSHRPLAVGAPIGDVIPTPSFRGDLSEALAGRVVRGLRGPDSGPSSLPPYWADLTFQPRFDADGRVVGAVYRSVDVSEHHERRLSLERDAAFRRSLLTFTGQVLSAEPDRDTYDLVLRHAVEHVPGADGGCVLMRADDDRFRFVAIAGFDLADFADVALPAASFAGRDTHLPARHRRGHGRALAGGGPGPRRGRPRGRDRGPAQRPGAPRLPPRAGLLVRRADGGRRARRLVGLPRAPRRSGRRRCPTRPRGVTTP